jgi:hypothetical protein
LPVFRKSLSLKNNSLKKSPGNGILTLVPTSNDFRKNFVPIPGQTTASVAPPPTAADNRVLWVLLAGLLTTAASLAGQYLLSAHSDVQIMGLYGDYVFPVGAMLVGLVASSGYALTSLWLGVRIRKGLLVTIVLLMLIAYFAAEFIEFKSRGQLFAPNDPNTIAVNPSPDSVLPGYHPLGFWEYFHLKAINFTWKKENDKDKDNAPLGMWGYAFVLLGIAGFTCSGLILPVVIGARSYCEPCRRYMKRRPIAFLPASMPYKKFSKNQAAEKAEYNKQHQATWDQASAKTQAMIDAAKRGDAPAFSQLLPDPPSSRKQVDKLPRRIAVSFWRCPACASGYMEIKMSTGQGKQTKVTRLAKEKLAPEFVRAVEK